MKLGFLGTRGNIEARNRRHQMHTSLSVSYLSKEIVIDCGEDWRGKIDTLTPDAILLTHSHPDHIGGLKEGAPAAVYAPYEVWRELKRYPIKEGKRIDPREPFEIHGIRVEAFCVEHSITAPAVGYRIGAGEVEIFYVPDVASVFDLEDALSGIKAYIGDGASLTRAILRRRGDQLIGHASFKTQLDWCQKLGVPKAYVTHCGSQIVKGDERTLEAKLSEMAGERGVKAVIAHDGMEVVLR